jgi:hypothetical protein
MELPPKQSRASETFLVVATRDKIELPLERHANGIRCRLRGTDRLGDTGAGGILPGIGGPRSAPV